MGATAGSYNDDNSEAVEVSGRIMMAAIIVLFMVVVFIVILHIYARCCWSRRLRRGGIRMTTTARHRMEIVSGEAHVQGRVGLDASVIQSIPVFEYSQKVKEAEYPQGPPECAVCLCEFEDKERGRLLPRCNHPFHVECIDMWLTSHSTCPICRTSASPVLPPTSVAAHDDAGSPVQAQSQAETSGAQAHDVLPLPTTAYPTNVLFWGTEHAVASASSAPLPETPKTPKTPRTPGKFVIEIPPARRDSFSSRGFCSPRGGGAAAGEDSMLSPGKSPSMRFRSIKSLLSRDKRMNNSPECSCTAASPSAAASASSDSGAEQLAVVLPV